jgi:long-chain acyl-CoA synthetase
VEQEVLRRIDRRLAAFPSYARVRRVQLTLDAWTVDDGLVTPPLKVRRPQVQQRFAEAIARLYAQAPGARRTG